MVRLFEISNGIRKQVGFGSREFILSSINGYKGVFRGFGHRLTENADGGFTAEYKGEFTTFSIEEV